MASDNQRRIRDIAVRFRRACLGVRIPFRDRLRYWISYFQLARRGVMEHSTTHDAVYRDGFWKRRYDKYCEKINQRLAKSTATTVEVPSFQHSELSLADLHLLMRLNIPFAVRGALAGLPMRDWTLDYLQAVAGECAVPINEAADQPSPDKGRPTKASNYYEFRTGTLGEVVESIRRGGRMRISTAEDVMHHDGGRLRRDIDVPRWEQVSGWAQNQHHWLKKRLMAGKVVGAQLLLQPANAFTLWHAEPGDNFFVLAQGVKDWTMAHPSYTAGMRPRVKTTTNYHGSNIDVREGDDAQRQRGFNGYPGIPKVHVHMQPGDMLRVPNHWWHTVVTQPGHYTVAATIRSNSPPNLTGFGYGILRLFDRNYVEMAKSFMADGRIHDKHIGYPRRSRSADAETAKRS